MVRLTRISILAALCYTLTGCLFGQALPEGDANEGIISEVEFLCDGPLNRISLEDLEKLALFKEGENFSLGKAHHTIARLFATELFHDVQIESHSQPDGQVKVSIVLIRRYNVSKIRFSGQVAVNQRELRRELAFREGEAFTQRGLDETIERLVGLYRRHGYFKAQINPDFILEEETATIQLNYVIDAGPRVTIRDFAFEVDGNLDPASLRELTKLKEGGPYSEDQREEDLLSLKTHLALQGYFRPEVFFRGGLRYEEDSDSVALTLRIVPHHQTRIELIGLGYSTEELAGLPLFKEGIIGELPVDETISAITKDFQARGFLLAKVDLEIEGDSRSPNLVRLTVDRGRKYELQRISFEGNTVIKAETLQSVLATQKPGIFGKTNLSRETLDADIQRISFLYEQKGFLKVSVETQFDTDDGGLHLTYLIQEGQMSTVRNFSFEGNQSLSNETLRAEIALSEGQPFSPYTMAQDRISVLSRYSRLGFADADIRTEVSYPAEGQVDVTYRIIEGQQYSVEDVIIVGNARTRRRTIEREILLEPGAPLSLENSLISETHLYDLSIFRRVRLSQVPSFFEPNSRSVLFNVEEAPQYTLVYGVGYSYNFGNIKSEGLRGTFGITSNNLAGRATTLALSLRAGSARQRGNLSYRLPRLFGRRAPTVLSLTVDNDERISTDPEGITYRGRPYNSLRVAASAQTERILSRRESLFYRYNFERVLLDLPEDLDIPPEFYREQEDLLLSSISLSYLNESRDEPSNPRTGFFLSGDAKLAGKFLGSQEQFFRIYTQGQYYHPISRIWQELILVTSLRIGIIQPFGSRSEDVENDVPISERFFAGGATTLRGFPLDLAGPLLRDPDTGEIVLVDLGDRSTPVAVGGNALVIGNLEFRFPLYKLLNGSLFYDVGNVFPSITKTGPVKLGHAVGLGLAIQTPIGPIRFDAAYNPDPPDVEGFDRWNFFINVGHPF